MKNDILHFFFTLAVLSGAAVLLGLGLHEASLSEEACNLFSTSAWLFAFGWLINQYAR